MLVVPDNFFCAYDDEGFEQKIRNTLERGVVFLSDIGIKVKISELVFYNDLYCLNNYNRNLLQENKTEKVKNALNMELLSANFSPESRQKISAMLLDFNLRDYEIDLNELYMGVYNFENTDISSGINENCNTVIKKSLKWINENYNKDITLGDAAQYVMLSPVYYGRIFKMNVGTSFTGYLLDLRLNKARHLLKDTPLNVREVANAVGYKDVNYFIRLFKKSYGVAPGEFKKQW